MVLRLEMQEVESPSLSSIATAQISQIIANVASSQYGGCSADRIDEVLAPYAEKNLPKHLKDAEEWVLPENGRLRLEETQKTSTMPCNLFLSMKSILFTSNGQTPFTSLGFGLKPVALNGKFKNYFEYSDKGSWFEHRTAIFLSSSLRLKEV